MLNDNETEENVQGLLLGLPDEMWEKILKCDRLFTEDISSFRLVSKSCKALAENLFNRWTITLDERCENDKWKGSYLENLLDLKIEKVTVVNLSKLLPFRSPGVIFRHPDVLKVIRIKPVGFYGISAENLHVLLQSRNLEVLELTLGSANLNSLLYSSQPPLIGYDFSILETMTIKIIYDYDRKHHLKLIEGNLIQRILKGSIFLNLNSLDVSVDLENALTAYQINCDVLEFIVKYGQTLKHVNIQIRSKGEWPDFVESADISNLKNCSKLKSLCKATL